MGEKWRGMSRKQVGLIGGGKFGKQGPLSVTGGLGISFSSDLLSGVESELNTLSEFWGPPQLLVRKSGSIIHLIAKKLCFYVSTMD